MPVSSYDHLSEVMYAITRIKPTTVLDIGIGFGKWGILCREGLEATHGRFQKNEWQVRIDGIEVFEQYRNPLWELVYDRVLIGDILQLVDELPSYDLILLCDVIEHFEKEVGYDLLLRLIKKGKAVIISSPRGFMPQNEAWGNEREEHKSGWGKNDLQRIPHVYRDVGLTFMAVLSGDQRFLDSLDLRHPLKAIGLRTVTPELVRLGYDQCKQYLFGR